MRHLPGPRTRPRSSSSNNRLIPNAIEPRAAVAHLQHAATTATRSTSRRQNPHVERLLMTAFVLNFRNRRCASSRPTWVVASAPRSTCTPRRRCSPGRRSRSTGRSSGRQSAASRFFADAHGRDHFTKAELALDKEGKFLAMRVHTTAAMGAYLSTFASCIPTILYATLLAGQYTTPSIYCEVTAVFTNTAPVDAYRGAGRPEATFVVERLVETAAREMKLDPAEIRRRNFITKFPYQTPVALCYDTGDYEATLGRSPEACRCARVRRAPQGSAKRAACGAGWATRRTSKHADRTVQRRRVRWARGPDCSRQAKCACIPPAK